MEWGILSHDAWYTKRRCCIYHLRVPHCVSAADDTFIRKQCSSRWSASQCWSFRYRSIEPCASISGEYPASRDHCQRHYLSSRPQQAFLHLFSHQFPFRIRFFYQGFTGFVQRQHGGCSVDRYPPWNPVEVQDTPAHEICPVATVVRVNGALLRAGPEPKARGVAFSSAAAGGFLDACTSIEALVSAAS